LSGSPWAFQWAVWLRWEDVTICDIQYAYDDPAGSETNGDRLS